MSAAATPVMSCTRKGSPAVGPSNAAPASAHSNAPARSRETEILAELAWKLVTRVSLASRSWAALRAKASASARLAFGAEPGSTGGGLGTSRLVGARLHASKSTLGSSWGCLPSKKRRGPSWLPSRKGRPGASPGPSQRAARSEPALVAPRRLATSEGK